MPPHPQQQEQEPQNPLRQRRRRSPPTPSRAATLLLAAAVAAIVAAHAPKCSAWRPPASSSSSRLRRAAALSTRRPAAASSSSGGPNDDAPSTSSDSRHLRQKRGALSRGGFAARALSLALGGAALGGACSTLPPMQTPLLPPAQARTEPLGVIDELLAECTRTDNCASSQDDRPPVFAEPWAYESSADKAMRRLREYVTGMPGAEVITADARYLRVEFRSSDGAVDDAEWFFVDPESDAIIEFRSARRGDKGGDNGANLRRLEKIRIALGFEKVPVLRNRRRALFIMESPLDAFGPSYGVDAPPPQEIGEAYKDADPFSPSWEEAPPYPRPSPQPPRDKK